MAQILKIDKSTAIALFFLSILFAILGFIMALPPDVRDAFLG